MCLAVGQNSLMILIYLILTDLIPTIQSMCTCTIKYRRIGFNCKCLIMNCKFFLLSQLIMSTCMYMYILLDSQLDLACLIKPPNYSPMSYSTIYTEIFARRNFSPISPSALIGEIFITRIFCPVLMIT